MDLDELTLYLEEIGFTDKQKTDALLKSDLTERWVMACQRAGPSVKNRGGFVWKGIVGGKPPAWQQGDGPKPKEPISEESFFAIADAHLSSHAAALFFDYDDERVRPSLRVRGGVFLKDNAIKEIRFLERKYRMGFSEEDTERLMKRAEQYAKEAMEQERSDIAAAKLITRHRRLELMQEGKDPNRFWGGATEEELQIWKSGPGSLPT